MPDVEMRAMNILSTGQLFPHKCQIRDMKLSGYNPSSLRYHCTACGGVLVLKLDRERWEDVFGEDTTFKLSKKILSELDVISDEADVQRAEVEMEPAPDPDKFVWTPPDE